MKKFVFCGLLYSTLSFSCPEGQHSECILPRPWGGCGKSVCVPNVKDPFTEMQRALNAKALQLAISGRDSETIKNREDCMVMVTAGLTVWGASCGGVLGGLAGGTAGAAAASLACRQAFPLGD